MPSEPNISQAEDRPAIFTHHWHKLAVKIVTLKVSNMKRIVLHLNLATLKVVLIILNQSLIAIDLLMLMLQPGMHN